MSSLIPYRHNRGLRAGSNSIFEDNFFRPFFEMGDFFGSSAFRVDVKEKDDHYELEAELPGVPQDQIELTVDNNMLTIAANMNAEKKEEKENYVYSERRSGRYQRSCDLTGINDQDITASYQDGILRVTLPKERPGKGPEKRKIDIN